jgi:hypothetical protein
LQFVARLAAQSREKNVSSVLACLVQSRTEIDA